MSVISLQVTSFAQPKKRSYNFTRAVEEAKEGNNTKAMEFLTKEVSENPKNGYAYMCMAAIYEEEKQYKDAMQNINVALKKLPKKDKKSTAMALTLRAHLFTTSGDTVRALPDLETAINLAPDEYEIMDSYANLLYELKRYDDSDRIYNRMVTGNPAGINGYMGLGRNAFFRGKYDDAVKHYEGALRLDDSYSSGYAFRGESYLKQGKYHEAIDDIIKALEIDNDTKAFFLLFDFPDEQTKLVVTRLKGMAAKDPYEAYWWYYIGQVYNEHKHYAEAIKAFKKADEIDSYPDFLRFIASCYYELGDYGNALLTINEYIRQDSDEKGKMLKADILGDAGDVDSSIAVWDEIIESDPDYFFPYYRRGFMKDNANRSEEALEDYDMAIMLEPDYAYAYLGRGDMLMRLGRTEEALEAYRKVTELDTVPGDNSCSMYAMLALGEKDKAIEFLNQTIESDPTDGALYYDAACLYSRIGDLGKSMSNLRIALEKGYPRYHHVRNDDDLTELRKLPEFEALLQEYESKVTAIPVNNKQEEEVSVDNERVEIPFIPEGGCLSVTCSINELPLNFVFDTGASTVSLSQVEANFMLKNGYLKRDDIIGTDRFMDANGNISEGTIINLREVDFGGLKLNNVRASVVRNQRAPLLLGQSVLGRLGSIEIDNPGKKLIITHSK